MKADWSLGRYEHTAAQLLPAAQAVIARAAPAAGEHVVDVGCGTGSAALLAAERGARVTGVDPAARLLDVARGEAARRGLSAVFLLGDAAALPIGDGEADAVVSSFGVIFAPDPKAAAAELARVTAPGGRVVFSAWLPGPLTAVGRLGREAVGRALGTPPGEPHFPWYDGDALGRLFAPLDYEVEVDTLTLTVTAASVDAYVDKELATHPLAVAGREILAAHGGAADLRQRMVAELEQANENGDGFRISNRYVVAIALPA